MKAQETHLYKSSRRNAKLGRVYVLHNNEGDRRATDLLKFRK